MALPAKLGVPNIVGLEVSRTAAIYVKKRLRNAECIRADARFPPFQAASFSAIVESCSLACDSLLSCPSRSSCACLEKPMHLEVLVKT